MKENNDFHKIDGIKIREQYFDTLLYFELSLIPMVIIISLGMYIKDYSFFCAGIIPMDIVYIGCIFITYLINILNRKFFGKVVLVVCDEGVYSPNKFIPWENIKSLTYEITWGIKLSRHGNILINNTELRIYDFPLYGFLKLKKNKKIDENVEISIKGIHIEILYEVFIIGVSILYLFMIGL